MERIKVIQLSWTRNYDDAPSLKLFLLACEHEGASVSTYNGQTRCNTIIVRFSPQVFVRSARANGCRLSDPRTTFPLFLSLGQPPLPHPIVVWPGHRVKGNGRESNPLPVFPIRWERESAFSSVSRGLNGEEEGAAGLVDGRGVAGEGRERSRLRYSPFRNQCPRYTKYSILFNGGNVEKYFVHVGLWRFVFLFFFFHFFFFPPDGFTRREDPLKNRIPFHVFSSSVIRDNGGLSFDNDDYRVFDRSKALLFRF